MNNIKISEQPKLLNDLVESLRQAAGGASQLVHMMGDPRWMMIREAIELTQEGVLGIMTIETKKIGLIKPS